MNLGNVAIPMARSRVVTTLSSNLASTKIVNVGGAIGTITGDHLTAVTGKLGAPPAMIPLDLTLLVSGAAPETRDRKSTRLNSSHLVISYAVFCLKKKKKTEITI